jgi:hypothetical protein
MIRALLAWLLVASNNVIAQEEQTCKWDDGNNKCFADPHMKEMTFDLGNGTETFWAYVPPDVSTFYQQEPGSKNALKPNFIGQFAKFVNLSPKVVRFYW